jgi:hypothetical protein
MYNKIKGQCYNKIMTAINKDIQITSKRENDIMELQNKYQKQ